MKKINALIMTLLILSNAYLLYSNYSLKKDVLQEQTTSTPKKKNFMSMMIETEAGSGNYLVSSSNTWPTDGYVFNSKLSKCEQGSILKWDDTNNKVVMEGNVSDKCYVYFDVYSPPSIADFCTSGQTLSSCITTFGNQGSDISNIYIHSSSLTNGAGDNSYRFAGANPNNYVCFGSDDATCPSENLYRIIGVIDGKVKLIHANGATTDMLGTDEGYVKTYGSSSSYKGNGDLTKIGRYKWNKVKNNNTWSTSTTNTINLNRNYLTYLDGKNTKWKNMIADTTWYVGGMTYNNGSRSNAKTAYNYEVGANKDASTTVNAKIGLMYVSDYGFAAAPSAWTTILYNYGDATIKNENWLYIGLNEWTISRSSAASSDAFGVYGYGIVHVDGVDYSFGNVVRPSFSLSSSIKFISGEGTAVNPIRINL